jgi:surface protein
MDWMDLLRFRKKETLDKKVFKVNLGDNIEILTYEELWYRFDNLTKKEQDYLNKNAIKCTNITEINLTNWDISNVTSYKDVFNAP